MISSSPQNLLISAAMSLCRGARPLAQAAASITHTLSKSCAIASQTKHSLSMQESARHPTPPRQWSLDMTPSYSTPPLQRQAIPRRWQVHLQTPLKQDEKHTYRASSPHKKTQTHQRRSSINLFGTKKQARTMERYIRQLALPEIDLIKQERLSQTRILMVGAGGLGAAALPYLASAGIGKITIADHDTVNISNLHRQTLYKTEEAGKNKAELTAAYIRALNPDITVNTLPNKISIDNPPCQTFDLILDGSDNFETKALLNNFSIKAQTPLISASINQWAGQIGVFEGYNADKACYRCIFPEFPTDAKNCNEAGILGTSAGIVGIMQAHTALLKLLNINEFQFLSINLKTLRVSKLSAQKDPTCTYCKDSANTEKKQQEQIMVDLISKNELKENTQIIDVRQPEELEVDPLPLPALNIPLLEFVARIDELPKGKPLAFVCAGNVRSRQAAEYLAAQGQSDVYVLDKFSL